jgi:hypothetical protein
VADFNTGRVILELKDAYGEFISDDVELRFRNLKLHSLDFLKNGHLTGAAFPLDGIPAFPTGNWQVDILTKKYRFKSVFVDLPSNGEFPIKETFFVNPAKVKPIFPTSADINRDVQWEALRNVLQSSTIVYAELSDSQKAGLLNLFAKMNHESADNAWSDVSTVFDVKPARIFATVKRQLWEKVKSRPQRFHLEPDNGSMHVFGGGWTRLVEAASFKTPDRMGNLQLTFADDADQNLAVDADLDDHQGLQHAFDVIKHKFSGDTNPYDIHDVLVKFHGIDPGYHFA